MSRATRDGASGKHKCAEGEPAVRTYVSVWAALLALLGTTVGSSFVPLGVWNSSINILIAVVKTLLVAVFFMHLRSSSTLIRLVAIVGVAWFSILIGLSLADFLTRAY
jgi:cytochrome c oxidase subunit 4